MKKAHRVHYVYKLNKFVADSYTSKINNNSECDTWVYSYPTACAVAQELNSELNKPTGIIIARCKTCHKPYIISRITLSWYETKGLKKPCHCKACINKRHIKV